MEVVAEVEVEEAATVVTPTDIKVAEAVGDLEEDKAAETVCPT